MSRITPLPFIFLSLCFPLSGMNWSGEIDLNRHYFYEDSIRPVDYVFDQLLIEAENSSDYFLIHASLDLRVWDNPGVGKVSNMTLLDRSYPYQFTLWEAYGTVYDLLIKNLDFSIGKQRIAWGTADKLNPTDNLNPLDLQDPLDFGKRIPTEAIKVAYYPRATNWSITGIWLPIFHSALIPRGEFPLSALPQLKGFTIVGFQDTIIQPKRTLSNSGAAFKLAGTLSNWDFSLSYFRGYDALPLEDSILISPLDKTSGDEETQASLSSELSFPKVQVLGFDLSGELKSVGLWGEFAYWIPKEFHLKEVIPSGKAEPHFTLKDSVVLKDPFLKFTLGGDYTFKNGPYLNLQWTHGFYTERAKDLQDYLTFRAEKKYFNDKFRSSIGGMFDVADWDSLNDETGYSLIPEVTYWPTDNVEIKLGVFYLDGKGKSLLGLWKDQDQVYLRTTFNF